MSPATAANMADLVKTHPMLRNEDDKQMVPQHINTTCTMIKRRPCHLRLQYLGVSGIEAYNIETLSQISLYVLLHM